MISERHHGFHGLDARARGRRSDDRQAGDRLESPRRRAKAPAAAPRRPPEPRQSETPGGDGGRVVDEPARWPVSWSELDDRAPLSRVEPAGDQGDVDDADAAESSAGPSARRRRAAATPGSAPAGGVRRSPPRRRRRRGRSIGPRDQAGSGERPVDLDGQARRARERRRPRGGSCQRRSYQAAWRVPKRSPAGAEHLEGVLELAPRHEHVDVGRRSRSRRRRRAASPGPDPSAWRSAARPRRARSTHQPDTCSTRRGPDEQERARLAANEACRMPMRRGQDSQPAAAQKAGEVVVDGAFPRGATGDHVGKKVEQPPFEDLAGESRRAAAGRRAAVSHRRPRGSRDARRPPPRRSRPDRRASGPTPGGVPVMSTSPGSSVMMSTRTTAARAARRSCRRPGRAALRRRRAPRVTAAPAGGGSATIQGPSGQKVSKLLPRVHWPSSCLQVAGGDVVAAGVAGHEVGRRGRRDGVAAAPHDEHELGLVVDLRRAAGQHDRLARTDHRAAAASGRGWARPDLHAQARRRGPGSSGPRPRPWRAAPARAGVRPGRATTPVSRASGANAGRSSRRASSPSNRQCRGSPSTSTRPNGSRSRALMAGPGRRGVGRRAPPAGVVGGRASAAVGLAARLTADAGVVQHAVLDRVDQRLPARLDDVLGDADAAPGALRRRWRRAAPG